MLINLFKNKLNRYLNSLTKTINSDINYKYNFINKDKKTAIVD